jgi:hypothetical protein
MCKNFSSIVNCNIQVAVILKKEDQENMDEEEEHRWNKEINVPITNIDLSPADCETLSFICDSYQVNFNNIYFYEALSNYLKSQ